MDDEQYMRRALELAGKGLGKVEPNPMVGCVIVRDGTTLAEGWHGWFGGPHAEAAALQAADRDGQAVRGATMYVTLEPCNHQGKTPPCTGAILSAGLGRVVVAMEDPDPQVRGSGIRRLRGAGVEVEVGVCEVRARRLLAPYVTLRSQGRPWVLAKWAQTADGCLALPEGMGRWISGEQSRRRVHALRAICDGVCIGSGTALADEPLLTNRSGAGRQPTRLVLDARLRLPVDSPLVESIPVAGLLVATTHEAVQSHAEQARALEHAGAELLPLPPGRDGGVALPDLLGELGRRQWTRLLVEGGSAVLRAFLQAGLLDEAWAFLAPMSAGPDAGDLPRFDLGEVQDSGRYAEEADEKVGPDRLVRLVAKDSLL